MIDSVLLFVGSATVILWGTAHVANTRGVVAGFEPLTDDNRRVLVMEWIGEGLTLCFIGTLVVLTTLLFGTETPPSQLVYLASAMMLVAMAVLSLFTGARASFIAYKMCPWVFGTSALLFVLGSFI